MFCGSCGKQIPDNSVFCSFCGSNNSVNVKKENIEKNYFRSASDLDMTQKRPIQQDFQYSQNESFQPAAFQKNLQETNTQNYRSNQVNQPYTPADVVQNTPANSYIAPTNSAYQAQLPSKNTFMAIFFTFFIFSILILFHSFTFGSATSTRAVLELSDGSSKGVLLDISVALIAVALGIIFLVRKMQSIGLYICFMIAAYISLVIHSLFYFGVRASVSFSSSARSSLLTTWMMVIIFGAIVYIVFIVWGCKLIKRLKENGMI